MWKRSLLRYLTQTQGKRGPCSFVMKSLAGGAEAQRQQKLREAQVRSSVASSIRSFLRSLPSLAFFP